MWANGSMINKGLTIISGRNNDRNAFLKSDSHLSKNIVLFVSMKVFQK